MAFGTALARPPLSSVIVNVDKDWSTRRITNLGAPVADTDALTPAYAALMIRAYGLDYKDIYSSDYGLLWTDLGVISAGRIGGMANLGNGIVILGDSARHVWRSTDYGETWTDLGVITGVGGPNVMTSLGNGIALIGDNNNHVFRSIDYGVTWDDQGVIATSAVWSLSYFGNGIVLLGDWNGDVFRSTDDGATWAPLGDIAAGSGVYAIPYLGGGIALMGAGNYHVYRSIDYGLTWADLGVITILDIQCMAYLGNGIVVMGGLDEHVWRSEDYGLTWTDLGVISVGNIYVMADLGNGVVIMGDAAYHIYRSTDYGETWADLGIIADDPIHAMAYLGNGVALMGDNNDHVFRSASPFQLNHFNPQHLDKVLQFGCLGAITANGTSYLAPGNGATQVNEIRMRVPRTGILRNLYVWQRVASGAGGRTDIYRVRVNGANTAITCMLDNETVGADIANSMVVAAGDQVSISLVSNNVADTSADVCAVVELA